jgi:hypothetical protein
MTNHTRITRCLAALVLCLVAIVMTPAVSSAAPAAAPPTAKLEAKLLDSKVKVNSKARIRGKLDLDVRAAALEPVVVQRLEAGVWVDVQSTTCRPNNSFLLSVSFSISASYTLRLFHPTTAVVSTNLVLTVL